MVLVVAQRFALVVVAVVFQLERQAIPRGLPEYAAEDAGRTAEIVTGVEGTSIGYIAGGDWTVVVLVVYPAQRVAEITTVTEVSPGNAQADVEVPESLVADEVFAGEQAGTADVQCAYREFRCPAAFLEQAEFGVYRLVLVALVATEVFGAVTTVADGRVAERCFQPVEWLQGKAVARIGIDTVGGDCDVPCRRHARRGRLHQPHDAEVVSRVAGFGMGHGPGQQQAEGIAELHCATSDNGWVAMNLAISSFNCGTGLSGPAALIGTRMVAPGAAGWPSWRFHRSMPRRVTWPSGWIR